MFIRTKIINGNPYLYAVYPYREGKKVKQRQEYLGKDYNISVSREEMGKLFNYSYSLINDLSINDPDALPISPTASMILKENPSLVDTLLKLSKELNHYLAQLIMKVYGYEEVVKEIPIKHIHYMLRHYVYGEYGLFGIEYRLPPGAKKLVEGLKQKLEDMSQAHTL